VHSILNRFVGQSKHVYNRSEGINFEVVEACLELIRKIESGIDEQMVLRLLSAQPSLCWSLRAGQHANDEVLDFVGGDRQSSCS